MLVIVTNLALIILRQNNFKAPFYYFFKIFIFQGHFLHITLSLIAWIQLLQNVTIYILLYARFFYGIFKPICLIK